MVPFKDIMIAVRTRVNITNNISRKFVARDSAQVAERRDEPDCPNIFFSRRLGMRTRTSPIAAACRAGTWRAGAAWGS